MARSKVPTIPPLTRARPQGISKSSRYKRKNGIKGSRTNKAKKTTSEDNAAAGHAAPGKHFPLFKLPPELRNNVYEKVFDQLPEVYLTTRTRSNLASRSALPRVSRQVRNEFIPIMYLCAPNIVSSVKNFDFGHIVTFLNRLSDAEMGALIETSSSRKITIELTLTNSLRRDFWTRFMERKHYDMFKRWVNRLENPTKRGTQIDASYVVVEAETSLWTLRNELESIKYGNLRKDAEVRKIIDAVNELIRERVAEQNRSLGTTA